jgi:hypothetical protein
MYFNLRLSTLQFFSRSICKLTKSSTFSLTFFFALGSFVGFGQSSIYSNPITGTDPSDANPYSTGEQFVSTNIAVSGISYGPDLSSQGKTNSFAADEWTMDNSISLTEYFQWVISPVYCKKVSFNTFSVVLYKNDVGPRNICLRSSVDNFSSNIPFTSNSVGTVTSDVVRVSGNAIDPFTLVFNVSSIQNTTSPITFRLYGYDSEDAGGNSQFGVNSFDFNGLVSNILSVNAGLDKSICRGNSIDLSGTTTAELSLDLMQNFDGVNTLSSTYTDNASLDIDNYALSGNGLRIQKERSTITTGNITNLIGFSNKQLEFRLASISGSASNGADAADSVTVSISVDNGVTWSTELKIIGNSNARWSYASGTGTASATFDNNNTPTTFTPTGGGERTSDGFSTVRLLFPNTVTQVQIRIGLRNNDDNERWAIDNVKLTGTPINTYTWSSNPSGFSSNLLNATATPTQNTTYTLNYTNGECSVTDDIVVSLPTAGTALSANNDNASCVVNQFGWVHFYHSSGRLIGSINSQGQNLGNVTMSSYVETSNTAVPSCASPTDPTLMTSVLRRHWLVNPQFQPSTPVLVRWPHAQTEFAALSSASTTNANLNDDAQSAADLKLSKYNGPNENANPLDNCGPGTTTLISQVANSGGPVSAYAPNIQGAVFYTEFAIPSFSEFWLHGSSNSSPLPVELTSFNAICEEGKGVNVTWTTASEHNSSYFDVLKSEDGHNWRSISTVSAAGNSTNIINYGIVDAEKANGVAYYKLMQYDIDGESKEYGPISSDCYHLGEMRVKTFPNPSGDEFYVELISPEATSTVITLVDAQGKSVYTRTVETEKGTNLYTFEALNVLPGMYYIQISNDITTPSVVKHSFR